MAIVYKEEWAATVQERVVEPAWYQDVMKVEITDTRTIHNPYRTNSAVATLTPYSAYTPAQVALTDESVSIDASFVVAEIIDRADLAQSGYLRQMELADDQAQTIKEKIENYILAQHAQYTDFDNASIGGAAGNITVAQSNIDDIIRGIKREIREAKGETLLNRNGGFIVWRPADFEILESYVMANGFASADQALRNGLNAAGGFDYMGMTHYSSNQHTAGHVFAGVKKVVTLGILRSTFGQIMVDDKDPGSVSGVSIVSRLDLKVKAWNKIAGIVFDVLVA